MKRDMAERQGRIDNFKAQEEEEMRHLAENHMTRAEAEAIRLPGSMQDMRRKRKNFPENSRSWAASIQTARKITRSSWISGNSMKSRLRI